MACLPRVWAWWYFPSPEPNNHYWLSESLLATGAFAFGDEPATFVEPLYPAFLAILRALAGSERLALLTQALVAATGGAAIFRLTARISGSSTAGLCAAALYAFDPYFVRQSISYIPVPLLLPLVLWSLDRLAGARRASHAAAAGVLLGLIFLTRASLLPVCFGGIALFAARRRWRLALVAAVVMAAIVLPWSVRSYRAGNGAFPTTIGQYLYLSTSPYAVGIVPIYDIGLLMRFAHFRLDEALGEPRSGHDEALADRILARRALEFAVTHPGETVALKVQNLLWIPAPILLPRNSTSKYTHAAMIDGRMQLTGVEHRPWTWEVLHTSFRSIVLVAAIAGLRRRREFDDGVLLVTLLSEFIVHTVLFPTTRLLVVFEAVLMVYAGIGARYSVLGIGAIDPRARPAREARAVLSAVPPVPTDRAPSRTPEYRLRSIVAGHMTHAAEQRRGTDRRRQPRGGRRPTDIEGFAPLVMVVGEDAVAVNLAEAVLAKLRFAVTTSSTVEDATRVLPGLKPDIVVAASSDAGRIRMEAPEHLSVVEMTDQMRQDPHVLIDSIRQSLRANA